MIEVFRVWQIRRIRNLAIENPSSDKNRNGIGKERDTHRHIVVEFGARCSAPGWQHDFAAGINYPARKVKSASSAGLLQLDIACESFPTFRFVSKEIVLMGRFSLPTKGTAEDSFRKTGLAIPHSNWTQLLYRRD